MYISYDTYDTEWLNKPQQRWQLISAAMPLEVARRTSRARPLWTKFQRTRAMHSWFIAIHLFGSAHFRGRLPAFFSQKQWT